MYTTVTFSKAIDNIVIEKSIPYLDAICHFCERNGVEIESAAKLVNKKIKQKLMEEAQAIHLVRK